MGVDMTAQDNLPNDLSTLLKKHNIMGILTPINVTDLISDLCVFIADRDGRVLEHGIKVGKKQ